MSEQAITVSNEQLHLAWHLLVDKNIEQLFGELGIPDSSEIKVDPVLDEDVSNLQAAMEKYDENKEVYGLFGLTPSIAVTIHSVDVLKEGLIREIERTETRISLRGLMKFGLKEYRASQRKLPVVRTMLDSLQQ